MAATMEPEATYLCQKPPAVGQYPAYLAAEGIFHQVEKLVPQALLSISRQHGAPRARSHCGGCVYEAVWCEGSSDRGSIGKVRRCRAPREKVRARIDSERARSLQNRLRLINRKQGVQDNYEG
jgi:hypothetical protein